MCYPQLRSLRQGGVYWAAPPCATWIWISRGSTGRSRTRPRGHVESFASWLLAGSKWFRETTKANKIIRRILYLRFDGSASLYHVCVHLRCKYAVSKKCFFVLENPVSTLVWLDRPMEAGLEHDLLKSIFVLRRSFSESMADTPSRYHWANTVL